MALNRWTGLVVVVLAAVAGFMAIVAPVYIADPDSRDLNFRELAGYSIEELRFVPTLILLFVVGAILGAAWGRFPGVIGCGTVGIFLLILCVDLILLSTGFNELASNSHNLLPFELVFFALFSVPGFLGALAGMFLQRRIERWRGNPSNHTD